jgi:hypothetical protein
VHSLHAVDTSMPDLIGRKSNTTHTLPRLCIQPPRYLPCPVADGGLTQALALLCPSQSLNNRANQSRGCSTLSLHSVNAFARSVNAGTLLLHQTRYHCHRDTEYQRTPFKHCPCTSALHLLASPSSSLLSSHFLSACTAAMRRRYGRRDSCLAVRF